MTRIPDEREGSANRHPAGMIEDVPPSEMDAVLALVLADPGAGRAADRARVRGFREYVAEAGLDCAATRIRRGGLVSAAVAMLPLPGRTALMLPATPDELRIDANDQARLLADGMQKLRSLAPHYVQSLVEPQAASKAAALVAAGFSRIARLLYLERDARFPWIDAPAPQSAIWLAYAPHTHALFARVVEETYRDSQDCPEISGLRPIADVLAGHRAAGPFNPQFWEIAHIEGVPAGCLLLSRVGAEMLEVVYMGVVSAFRRRGVGELLLRRALAHARADHRARLTLVVDERNAVARRLYERLAFRASTTRDVYLALRSEPVENL